MELKGKKINFLGDSITERYCATAYRNCYVEVLKRECGLAEARNYGIAGTRIARQQTPSEMKRYDLDFCSRYAKMDEDADVIVVFGGTNDHGHGDAPLGKDSDRTPDTFCGACHTLFAGLLERFPNAKIVVLTPLHRADENTPKEGSGVVLEDYVNCIRAIAQQYALPVLDLFNTSAIRANVPEIAERLTTDALHPNDEGHAVLAAEIAAFLRAL